MGLSKVTRQIEANLPRNTGVHWTRSVAAGTLFSSAVLLITGRRRAALAMAAAGAAVALLEDPEGVRRFWGYVPSYIKAGQQLFARMESVVEQAGQQADHFRDLLRRA